MGGSGIIPLQLYDKLFEAATAFEKAVWNKVSTKEEYAYFIREKITAISSSAHKAPIPAPVTINTPKAQRAIINSPPVDKLLPLVIENPELQHLVKIENGVDCVPDEPYKLLSVPEDLYKTLFYPHSKNSYFKLNEIFKKPFLGHYNFFGQKGESDVFIISILASPVLGIYKALKITKLVNLQI